MTGAPAVSVLVPVHDGADVLAAAVASALAQEGAGAIEVLVVDDASTDGTRALAEELARRDPRVRVFALDVNAGPGAARSHALARARGEWVAVLDADDALAPGRFAHLLGHAEAAGLDAVADNLALVDPGLGRVVGHAFPLGPDERRRLTPESFLAASVPGGRVTLGWMQPVMRRAFLAAHGIDWPALRHAEDLVLAMRLLAAGARFELLGRPGYLYTQRRGTVSGRASAQSRTRRSAAEQQRAVSLIEAELGPRLGPTVRARLAAMHAEISVTTHVLEARDALHAGQPGRALRETVAALSRPRALARCLLARYGPHARRIGGTCMP